MAKQAAKVTKAAKRSEGCWTSTDRTIAVRQSKPRPGQAKPRPGDIIITSQNRPDLPAFGTE